MSPAELGLLRSPCIFVLRTPRLLTFSRGLPPADLLFPGGQWPASKKALLTLAPTSKLNCLPGRDKPSAFALQARRLALSAKARARSRIAP